MPINELISMIRQGSVSGSKSTVLSPLIWVVGILTTAAMGAAQARLPTYFIGILCGCMILSILGLMFAFGWFAWKNPDALRSEKYTLTKMAIDRYMAGDDAVGLALVDREENTRALAGATQSETYPPPQADAKPPKKRPTKQDKMLGGPEQ